MEDAAELLGETEFQRAATALIGRSDGAGSARSRRQCSSGRCWIQVVTEAFWSVTSLFSGRTEMCLGRSGLRP